MKQNEKLIPTAQFEFFGTLIWCIEFDQFQNTDINENLRICILYNKVEGNKNKW